MIISRNNNGNIIGWRETYISKDEIVEVSVNGNINTITTRDRTTGRVASSHFLPIAASCGSRASSRRFCRGCAFRRETPKRARTECIGAPAVCGGIAKSLKSRVVYSMNLETEESCPGPDW
jgi:hypothetical protein